MTLKALIQKIKCFIGFHRYMYSPIFRQTGNTFIDMKQIGIKSTCRYCNKFKDESI
jgi:hypothetical protein